MALRARGDLRGGVYVTASHNPGDQNGLKFYRPDGVILYPEQAEALTAMWRGRAWLPAGRDRSGRVLDPRGHTGTAGPATSAAAISAHIERVASAVDCGLIRRTELRVVADYNNGAGCLATPVLLAKLGVAEVVAINDEPNGLFAHKPEPVPEHMEELAGMMAETGFDIGFAQDPDADRVSIAACVPGPCGEVTGVAIGEEYTLALAAAATAEWAAARGMVGSMATNYSTSRMLETIATKLGWPFRRCAVGEVNVVNCLQSLDREWEEGGSEECPEATGHFAFGGEGGGGVIDPRNQPCRDSLNAIALILQGLAAWKLRVILPERERPADPRLHLHAWRKAALESTAIVKDTIPTDTVEEQEAGMAAVRARYLGASGVVKSATDDGVWVQYADRSWLHVRPSNTERIIRVIAEHDTQEQAEGMVEEALGVVGGSLH
jgi:phosphomannomutase